MHNTDQAIHSIAQLIDQLEQLTKRTVLILDIATYDEMLEFVEARDIIIQTLQPLHQGLPEEASKKIGKKFEKQMKDILSHDTEIMAKLANIQAETTADIAKTSVARKQRSAYDATYTLDSVYFDKKK